MMQLVVTALTFFVCCAYLLEAIILQLMILAQKWFQWLQKIMMCRYLHSTILQNPNSTYEPIVSCHEQVILKDMFFCWLQAYLFDGYWEDIGTIKSFFEANLALTDQVYISIDIVSGLIFLCQDNNFIY